MSQGSLVKEGDVDLVSDARRLRFYFTALERGAKKSRWNIEKAMLQWNKKKDNAPELLYLCIKYLQPMNLYLTRKDIHIFPFDPQFLLEITEKVIGSKSLKLLQQKHESGVMVELLCLFGCSRNQALDALAEWRKESRTTIRTANEKLRAELKNYSLTHDGKRDTLSELYFFKDVADVFFSIEKKRPFPLSHPKAVAAYSALKRFYSEVSVNAVLDTENLYKKQWASLTRYAPLAKKVGYYNYSNYWAD